MLESSFSFLFNEAPRLIFSFGHQSEGVEGNFRACSGVRVNQRIRFVPNANDFPPVSAGKLGEGESS